MFEVVEECPEEFLLEKEEFYINTLQPDMNHIIKPTRPTPDRETIERAKATKRRNNLLLGRRASNIKKVYQYSLEGDFIQEWKAASDAAAFYNCEVSALCACCRQQAKTCCGFQWSYKKEKKTKPLKNWKGNTIVQYNRNMEPIMLWYSFSDIQDVLHINEKTIKEVSNTKVLYKESYWIVNPIEIEQFQNIPLERNPALSCKKYENNNPRTSKNVYQYDMQGNYLGEYPSVMEASRQLGVENRGIGLCADEKQPKYKSAHGFRWSYTKYNRLPEYVNNSSKAVSRQIIVFDVLTGEEKTFESVAQAVRHYNPNTITFDSDCSSLCYCANHCGYYLNRYIAKTNESDFYKLTSRNTTIYNSVNSRLYSNLKEASKDSGLSIYTIKKYCREENNKEWLFINKCARVKLRESGKLFI